MMCGYWSGGCIFFNTSREGGSEAVCIPRGPTTVSAQGAVGSPAPAQRGLEVTHVVHWSRFALRPTAPVLEFESLARLPWGGPVRGTAYAPENLTGSGRAWASVTPHLCFKSSLPYSMFLVSFQAHLAEGLPPRNHLHKNVYLGVCFQERQ